MLRVLTTTLLFGLLVLQPFIYLQRFKKGDPATTSFSRVILFSSSVDATNLEHLGSGHFAVKIELQGSDDRATW